MSEKIWKAYALGVIPVVLGSNAIQHVLPTPDSYINVHDFKTARELASHLKEIAGNESLFNSFFAWRNLPLKSLSPGFKNIWQTSSASKDQFKCCIARGVARAQMEVRIGAIKPIPGLRCDVFHDWESFVNNYNSS